MIRTGLRIQYQSQQKGLNLLAELCKPKHSQQLSFRNCHKLSLQTSSHSLTLSSQKLNCSFRKHFFQRDKSLTQGVLCSTSTYRHLHVYRHQSVCHRDQITRQISNSCQLKTNNQSGDPDAEQPAEWVHPNAREDSIVKTDEELKSLLHDLALDFGENVSSSVNDDENYGSMDKAVKIRIPLENIVYFDGSGSNGGFGKVESNLDEELQQIKAAGNDKIGGTINRTANGVLTVAEIVDILREDNARDICVIKVPKHKQYVDYFVIVTGRSTQHLKAMTGYLNKIYKHLKQKEHQFIKVEGKDTDDWMCIDFGDIVVHFMLQETRELYELEMLWTLGPEYDDQYHRIVQYQSVLNTPVHPTKEELETMESATSEGYNVVIENEGTVPLTNDRRI